jgi:hypothetical protein
MTSAKVPGPSDPEVASRTPSGALPPWMRRSRQRQFAWGLVAYGLVGVLLAAASAFLVIRAMPVLASIDRQRTEIVRALDVTAATIDDIEQGAARAGASLRSAAESARGAASLSGDLSGTMTSLRDTSGSMSILGSRPFAELADDFDRVAGRASALASNMTSLAGSLDSNTLDFATVSADATALRLQVTQLRDVLRGDGPAALDGSLDRLLLLALAFLLWLAAPAIASLALGVAWLRATRGRSPAAP